MYGEKRTFRKNQSRIEAIPQVNEQGKIERIHISHMDGQRDTLNEMTTDIKLKYEGALYSTWEKGC